MAIFSHFLLLPQLVHAETLQQTNARIDRFLYNIRNASTLSINEVTEYHKTRIPLNKNPKAAVPGSKPRETRFRYSTEQQLREKTVQDGPDSTSTITDGRGSTTIQSFKTNEPVIQLPPNLFPNSMVRALAKNPQYLNAPSFATPYRFEWVRKDLNVYRRLITLPSNITPLLRGNTSTPPVGTWLRTDQDDPDRVYHGRYDWDIQSNFGVDGRNDIQDISRDLIDPQGPYLMDTAKTIQEKTKDGKVHTTLFWKARPEYRTERIDELTKKCIQDSDHTCSNNEIAAMVDEELRGISAYFQLELDEQSFPITFVTFWHDVTDTPIGCETTTSADPAPCKNTMRTTINEKTSIGFQFGPVAPIKAPRASVKFSTLNNL